MNKSFIVVLRSSGTIYNDELEKVLKNMHYEVLTFPILKIKHLCSKPINLHNVQALLTTSSNAIQIFSELSKNRIIPIYTVGSTSKKLAKRLGFKNVIDCQGDSGKMFKKVLNTSSKSDGSLIYVGAKNISLDLPNMLRSEGYEVKRYIVYKTEEVKVIDEKLKNLIKLKKVKWIVLLSKRGAFNFNKLFLRSFNFSLFEKIKFACLSENIAKELNYKIKLKFFPNQPTLNLLKNVIMKNE